MINRTHLILIGALLLAPAIGAFAQDAAKKKANFPPPEQSSTVGVLGARHSDPSAPAASYTGPPPPVTAAPEIPKVEAEAPTSLPADPRAFVQTDLPGAAGRGLPAPPPSGYLVDHPVISGLIAGLIGSDLGSRLYGGAMMGDRNAAMIGYGLRVVLILSLALVLFRLIGQMANRGTDLSREARGAPERRREPSFGKSDGAASGRREPRFGPGPER